MVLDSTLGSFIWDIICSYLKSLCSLTFCKAEYRDKAGCAASRILLHPTSPSMIQLYSHPNSNTWLLDNHIFTYVVPLPPSTTLPQILSCWSEINKRMRKLRILWHNKNIYVIHSSVPSCRLENSSSENHHICHPFYNTASQPNKKTFRGFKKPMY